MATTQPKDHPRVCGEKDYITGLIVAGVGSPPRMRGKERICRNGVVHFGITPAYAGKSLNWMHPTLQRKDHPRLCGEKTKKIP